MNRTISRDAVLKATGIAPETLRRWARVGLVTPPHIVRKGRAGGLVVDYSYETPYEILSSKYLSKNYSIALLAEARREAQKLITETCYYEMEKLLEEVAKLIEEDAVICEEEGERGLIERCYEEKTAADEYPKEIYCKELVFRWLMLRYKAEFNIPFDTAATLTIDYKGCFDNAAECVKYWGECGEQCLHLINDEMVVCWEIGGMKKSHNDKIKIVENESGAILILKTA